MLFIYEQFPVFDPFRHKYGGRWLAFLTFVNNLGGNTTYDKPITYLKYVRGMGNFSIKYDLQETAKPRMNVGDSFYKYKTTCKNNWGKWIKKEERA